MSDTSSLLIEAFATGKPVVYCGRISHFDRAARKWARLMYRAEDWGDMGNCLCRLLEGDDPKKTARDEYICTSIKYGGMSGKKIIDFIIEDFFRDR